MYTVQVHLYVHVFNSHHQGCQLVHVVWCCLVNTLQCLFCPLELHYADMSNSAQEYRDHTNIDTVYYHYHHTTTITTTTTTPTTTPTTTTTTCTSTISPVSCVALLPFVHVHHCFGHVNIESEHMPKHYTTVACSVYITYRSFFVF